MAPPHLISLAPTFDHASSLGRNERDEERRRRLSTRDKGSAIETYVRRARSAFYSSSAGSHPLSTVDAFAEGARIAARAGPYWLSRLQSLAAADFALIFDSLPPSEISDPSREFALEMISANKSRLLSLRK